MHTQIRPPHKDVVIKGRGLENELGSEARSRDRAPIRRPVDQQKQKPAVPAVRVNARSYWRLPHRSRRVELVGGLISAAMVVYFAMGAIAVFMH